MSLYRKHRPQKFTDLVGQEHVKKVLTNAIGQGKISHAYLFSGPRGTGKTTMARLLAKALNCKKRFETRVGVGDNNIVDNKPFEKQNATSYQLQAMPTGRQATSFAYEPCNECVSCVEITGDRSLDVIEIDAASNRGIDEIRELRDKVRYAPSSSAYKVYIIDEVHMLTKEAFNALLKTLEEPPKHAVFIMATTELHKVPDTILSRTQQFDFKRASFKELITNLLAITKKEKISIAPDAVELIARAGDGSFRDSLSILDQIASLNEKEIQLNHVKEILGLVPQNLLDDFVEKLEQNDARGAIDLIDQIYNEGYDLAQFNQTVIEALRDKMIINSDYNLLKVIKKFIEAGQEMKYAQIVQIPMELAVVEIMQNDELGIMNHGGDDKSQNSKVKIQNEKSKVKSEENEKINSQKPIASPEVDSITATDEEPVLPNQDNPVIKQEVDTLTVKKDNIEILNLESVESASLESAPSALLEKWPEVVGVVLANNHALGTLLKDAKALEIKDGKLMLGVKFKFYAERIMASDKITIVLDAIEKVLGDKLGVECVVEEVRVESKSKSEEEKTLTQAERSEAFSYSNLVDDALEVFGE